MVTSVRSNEPSAQSNICGCSFVERFAAELWRVFKTCLKTVFSRNSRSWITNGCPSRDEGLENKRALSPIILPMLLNSAWRSIRKLFFVALSRILPILVSMACVMGSPLHAQTAGPIYPVLFVHGWNSNGSTWAPMIHALDDGTLIGGRIRSAEGGTNCYWRGDWADDRDPLNYLGALPAQIPAYKRYFAIDFTDSWNLSFYEQARQLKVVIDCIKTLTSTTLTSTSKVSLVAHSMGGLASRTYIQSLAAAAPYPMTGDVERLITIGTPHNGANAVADIAGLLESPRFFLENLSSQRLGISIAVQSLTFPSIPINELNDQSAVLGHKLPPIKYTSIRFGSLFGIGDGLVSFASQSLLANLPAGVQGALDHQDIPIDYPTTASACYKYAPFLPIGGSPLYHICETTDPKSVSVVSSLLSQDVRAIETVGFSGLSPSGFNAEANYQISAAPPAFIVGIEWGTSGNSFTNQTTANRSGSFFDSYSTRITGISQGTIVYFRAFTIVNGVKKTGVTKQVTIPSVVVALLAQPVLTTPTNVAASLAERPSFSWFPVVNADSYRIFIGDSPTSLPTDPLSNICGGCLVNALVAGVNYQPPGNVLRGGQTYFWRVRASNVDRSGDLSEIRQFTVAVSPLLAKPTPLLPSDGASVSGSPISLSWQSVVGATSYRVIIARDAGTLGLQPSDSACPTCTLNLTVPDGATAVPINGTLFSPGSTYYWRVKARNAAQYGSYSDIRRFVVSQSQCTFAFTQSSLTASVSGGTLPFTLSTQSGCTAPISSNQSFCVLSTNSVTADSFGQASVSATLAANATTASRSCTITLGSAIISISQAGTAPATAYAFTLNQSSGGTATGNPGTGTYSIGTNINLTAFSSLGFKFVGWQDSGTIVSTSQNWSFSLFSARTMTPVFSSTVTTVTGLTSPNFSPDQKWRVLGTGFDNTKNWQGNGETASVIGGNTYRIDCADTPYFLPVPNTFSISVPGTSTFTCNYVAKALQPPAQNLTFRAQPRLASGLSNSLARLDDGRVVIWGSSLYTDFPNYGINSQNSGVPLLLRPLFLPNSNDVAGVSLGAGQQNGMFTLSATGVWRQWTNPANSGVRIPTIEPALNGFVKMSGNFGLKSDGSLWFINQSGVNTPRATLANIVDIAGSFSGTFSQTIALRNDGAVIGLTDTGGSSGCPSHGISFSPNNAFDNCIAPVALPSISRVISIAVGSGNAYAVRDDGTFWVWGQTTSINGGVVRDPNEYRPLQIPGISDAAQVVASSRSASLVVYVRTNAGQVYAFGNNNLGQLGRGTVTTTEPLPQLIAGMNNIVELGQSDGSSLLAVDGSGFVWTVGLADAVGNGTSVATQSTPVKVSCPNGYVGDLNLTAFSTSCIAAAANTLTLTDIAPSLGKQVRVNGVAVTLPYTQSFPANTQVTLEMLPDVGVAFRDWRGDMFDFQSRIRSLTMNRDWNIQANALDCTGNPVNLATVMNGSQVGPISASSTGGVQTVSVYSNISPASLVKCHWGFSTTDSWLQSNADGFGEAAFALTIAPNPTNVQRTGSFRLAGPSGAYSIPVTQAASATDTQPYPFSLASLIGAMPSTLVQSESITVFGINTAAAISISGGEYSIGCNGTFSVTSAIVANGDLVCVRHTSATSGSTSVTTTLTIGGVSGSFVSTTAASGFVVTPTAGSNGTISPNSAQTAAPGSPLQFTVTANSGYIATVSSGCGGTLTGTTPNYTYTIAAVNADCAVSATFALSVARIGVQSRKTHASAGVFDLPIDVNMQITDPVTVEPRIIGSGHTIVFQFNQTITATGTVAAIDAASSTLGATSVAVGNEVIVTLASVPNATRVKISLTSVNGTFDTSASLGFLTGDVNNSRSVNSSDISAVKARSGQTTTAANFQFDLNASGSINSSDISTVKARSGMTLP